jgi:hypothetical protein
MNKEIFRLYMLVRKNGFTPKFAKLQACQWFTGLKDTYNITRYYQNPSEGSKKMGNSY